MECLITTLNYLFRLFSNLRITLQISMILYAKFPGSRELYAKQVSSLNDHYSPFEYQNCQNVRILKKTFYSVFAKTIAIVVAVAMAKEQTLNKMFFKLRQAVVDKFEEYEKKKLWSNVFMVILNVFGI